MKLPRVLTLVLGICWTALGLVGLALTCVDAIQWRNSSWPVDWASVTFGLTVSALVVLCGVLVAFGTKAGTIFLPIIAFATLLYSLAFFGKFGEFGASDPLLLAASVLSIASIAWSVFVLVKKSNSQA